MRFLIQLICLSSLFISLIGCHQDDILKSNSDTEYIITRRVPDSLNKNCWFNVMEIYSKKQKCVYAVQEPEGSYYLPIHSRLPSFNNKVLDGVFIKDSVFGMPEKDIIFKVTKIIRDTTSGFPN